MHVSTTKVLRKRALLLSLAFALSAPAFAQSYLGGIYGRLAQAQGATIAVSNPATGYRTTLAPDSRGYYSVGGLAPGQYTVQLMQGGKAVGTQSVTVRAGANAPALFNAPAASAEGAVAAVNAKQLGAVNVTAATPSVNSIDTSTVEKSQVWSAQEYNKLPLQGRDIRNVAAMQSQVVVNNAHGGGAYGGTPQFNGASADENRYFYNQFDATDSQNYDSPTVIPDEALESVQSVDSGFGAKYGSATGGVVSANVKQGTNDFKAGLSYYYLPPTSVLRSNQRNIYNPQTGDYSTRSKASQFGAQTTQNYYVAGPLIRDKLFYYVLATVDAPYQTRTYDTQYKNVSRLRDEQLLANVTWNIADGHTLDVLLNRRTNYTNNYHYLLGTPYQPGTASRDAYSTDSNNHGNWIGIANYQGRITDTLTFAAMAGFIKDRIPSDNSGIGLPRIDRTDPITGATTTIVPGADINSPTLYYKRGGRVDFEWTQFENHDIKFGGESYSQTQGGSTLPAENYHYLRCNPSSADCFINGVRNPSGTRYFRTDYLPYGFVTGARTKGIYLDDSWRVTDQWLLYAGLRHDVYVSQNPDTRTFLRLPFNSPRLGVAWDVHGDSTLKIGATAGRYASNIGLNYNTLAGSTEGDFGGYVSTQTYYTYTGMDATGRPIGAQQVGPVAGSVGTRVLALDQNVSRNVKPNYSDQFSLYAQQQVGDHWTVGVTGYMSKLKSLMNRYTDIPLVQQYLAAQGYPDAQVSANYLFNPGRALVIPVDLANDGQLQTVTIPNSYLGFRKPRRTVYQATFNLDHPFSDAEPFYLSASYTWRHMFGTVDGTTSYDQNASGLARTGYNDGYSVPGFTDGSGGNLNTDNRNAVKVFGYYKFLHTDWLGGALHGLRVGGSFVGATGAPSSCLSTYPGDLLGTPERVGSSANEVLAFYCGDSPANPLATATTNRGHGKRYPTTVSIGVDLGYDWDLPDNHFAVDLKVDNLLNQQREVARVNTFTNGDGTYNNLYGSASIYQAPRSSLLTFRWDYH